MEVVGVLEADGHADQAVGDAELGPLGGGVAAGDRGGVGEQRLGAAERQGDAGQPAALDARRWRLGAAGHLEGDHACRRCAIWRVARSCCGWLGRPG